MFIVGARVRTCLMGVIYKKVIIEKMQKLWWYLYLVITNEYLKWNRVFDFRRRHVEARQQVKL